MKCPACGYHKMVTKISDETLSYGSESLTLHDMRGDFCTECGEGIWSEESYRRYTAAQEALMRKTRSGVGTDIRRIRKALNLTQSELAQIFGVGKVAFSRYERGETSSPGPVIKLLKLVERHPDLLSEVRDIERSTGPRKEAGKRAHR
jgi:HTH-type transcriptional regulator/antitoxin MqsA